MLEYAHSCVIAHRTRPFGEKLSPAARQRLRITGREHEPGLPDHIAAVAHIGGNARYPARRCEMTHPGIVSKKKPAARKLRN